MGEANTESKGVEVLKGLMLDSERHQEIVFKSTAAEPTGKGRWTVQVTLKDGRYTGETTVKQTDYGIKPPGKAGVRTKDEVKLSSTCGWRRKTRNARPAKNLPK